MGFFKIQYRDGHEEDFPSERALAILRKTKPTLRFRRHGLAYRGAVAYPATLKDLKAILARESCCDMRQRDDGSWVLNTYSENDLY